MSTFAKGLSSRRGLRVCLVLLCLFCALNVADAQRLRFRSSGRVTFSPTSEVYLAALGSAVEPEPSSPNIRMRVDRSQRYLFRAEPISWSAGAPELQARYTFSSRNGGTFVTSWLSLERGLQGTVSGPDRRTEINVDYRVRLTGQEVAGSYTTPVRYSAGDSSIQHDLRVIVPTATTLRINNSLVGAQTATVNFDYSGSNVMAYLQATETLAPLRATSSDIRTLEVFTNNPQGYTVTVDVRQADPSPSGSLLADNLYLAGQSAQGRRFRSTSPTYGFKPLVLPDDFSLRVDGLEEPDAYTFQLTYNVQANP